MDSICKKWTQYAKNAEIYKKHMQNYVLNMDMQIYICKFMTEYAQKSANICKNIDSICKNVQKYTKKNQKYV